MASSQQSWQSIASSKQEKRWSLIPEQWRLSERYSLGSNVMNVPETCGILTATEIEISSHDAVQILSLIADGTYSCESVTVAFCKRAAIAQQLVSFPLSVKEHVLTIFRQTALRRSTLKKLSRGQRRWTPSVAHPPKKRSALFSGFQSPSKTASISKARIQQSASLLTPTSRVMRWESSQSSFWIWVL